MAFWDATDNALALIGSGRAQECLERRLWGLIDLFLKSATPHRRGGVASGNWYDHDMGRFRVQIAKSQDGGHWQTIAKGTWEPGSDPVLKGESVPEAVLEDLVRIDPKGQESGTSHAQAGYTRYKMAFLSN